VKTNCGAILQMSFIIERSHTLFKHIIRLGPQVDAEAIAELAKKRDYTITNRQINTPTGPLKEYMFRSKTNPQSLIIFSQRGFVIDAQPNEDVLPLFREAYDFYEKVLGDLALTTTVQLEITGKFDLFSPVPVNELIGKLYRNDLNKLQFNSLPMQPFGVSFAASFGQNLEEIMSVSMQPMPKDPKNRMTVIALYRSKELDEALQLIEKLPDEIAKIVKDIAKVK